MPLLRQLITPTAQADGCVHLLIRLVEVDEACNLTRDAAGQVLVQHSEEVVICPGGKGLVAGPAFEAAILAPLFFVDRDWRRHFVVKADPAEIATAGQAAELTKS